MLLSGEFADGLGTIWAACGSAAFELVAMGRAQRGGLIFSRTATFRASAVGRVMSALRMLTYEQNPVLISLNPIILQPRV